MEQTTEFWLNIIIPILMCVGLISTLVILWKYNLEIPVEKIDDFLQLFKRKENGERSQLIKTEDSVSWSVSFNQESPGPHATCASSTSDVHMYGAIPKHMKAVHKHTGAIPKYMGAVPKHTGAIPKQTERFPKILGANT